MSNDQFVCILIGISFVSTIVFGVRRLALPVRFLREALSDFAECVGASMVFLAINEIAGMILLFAIRGFWGYFGLYGLGSGTLIAFSLFQGFLFQMWWRRVR